eukprot:gnl/MRDRNA2_/MRDRNA2_31250_c0_seq1.p1 gnl/MRDRNA2_/MRDRNA2_31250_c0~~gnl/MRDRNA2_/MRDRNA2_31250_c0_seq1.p1  ORF type:complete len:192 (-),score=8.04 gnl/MRDRNA2_/MRDRNA2_31250_c0_seq1:126-701(-)
MSASAPFASPYRAICIAPQYLPACRTRYGKRLSDITLEGATFRSSFLNHQTLRETPKKQLQRIFTVPDSLSRTANLPVLSPEAFPDPWNSAPVGSRGAAVPPVAVPSQIRRPRSSSGVSRGHSVSTSHSLQLRPLTAPNMATKDSKYARTGDSVTSERRGRDRERGGHSLRTSSAPAGSRKMRGGEKLPIP